MGNTQTKAAGDEKSPKRTYAPPSVESAEAFERAALGCTQGDTTNPDKSPEDCGGIGVPAS
ncbi:MAG: hypothetical protein AB2A00_36020 [Myxococcota bacterium]